MKGLLVCAAAVVSAGCGGGATAAEAQAAGDRELAVETVPAARRAVARYEEALKLTRDPATQARIHAQLAVALAICAPDRVKAELEKVVEIAGPAGDDDDGLAARATLVGTSDSSLEARIASLRALVAQAHSAGARRAEVVATAFLANLLVDERKMNEATDLLGGVLELARGAHDARLEKRVEHADGRAYYALGDLDKSMAHLQRALEVSRAAHLPVEEAEVATAIGNLYLWIANDNGRALVYLTRAVAGYAELGLDGSAAQLITRTGVATAQGKLGDGPAAIATLTKTLADARALATEDPANPRASVVLTALVCLGPFYVAAGRGAEATAVFAEAAQIAQKIDDSHAYTLATFGVANVALQEHRWKDAEATLGPAIAFIAAKEAEVTDENLKLSFSAAMRHGQEQLFVALAGEEDWGRAFAATERMRSRRLLAGLGSDEIVDGAGAQALLDDDTTLIEYAFATTRVYAVVVDKKSIQGIDLGAVKDVRQAAQAWYALASVPAPPAGALDAATRKLADSILAPIVPRLGERAHRLVIVPDKGLAYVAFAALPLADGKPLVDRFEIVYLPSASVLRALRGRGGERPRPTRELAILADPIFDRTDARLGGAAPPAATLVVTRGGEADLVRLPSTHAEAQAIAALLPPSQVFVAEGKAATRAAALGPEVAGARYVHFATHAILDNVDPDRSALALSQVDDAGNPVDGYVRAPDIEKLRLAADLVVLSACRTAIGKRFDGEGLVGLTRAFLRAGVPRVVSSLWQVDDAATADLMSRFYRGLLVDKASPPAALRRAQLDAGIARGNGLRLWAGFAFYGDWR